MGRGGLGGLVGDGVGGWLCDGLGRRAGGKLKVDEAVVSGPGCMLCR